MLIKILIAIAVIILVLVIVILQQPDTFRVSRQTTIHAAPAVVFAQVNDLRQWQAWSPWAKMDPDAKTIFNGPSAGVGASMSWAGKKTGEGTMAIMESIADEKIVFKLEFFKPMQGTNMAEFQFTPDGNQTLVSWSMYGKTGFMGKAMGLIMNCEKMLGPQFEQGLADLKAVSEAQSK